MSNLTAIQANRLANEFLSLAQSIGEFRYKNYDNLNNEENQKLRNYHWSVMNSSDDIFTLSANLVLEDTEEALTEISGVSSEMKNTYKDLQNIQKAIDIAASVVTLGAAIISKNPQAIADSLSGLIETWKA